MLEGLDTAAAGMAAQQQRLDAVANDLANANTNGYKHERVGFSRPRLHAGRALERAGRAHRLRRGAIDAGRGFEQGALRQTGAPLDVAIQGEGFLQVACPTAAPASRATATCSAMPRGA